MPSFLSGLGSRVPKSLYDAQTIVIAIVDNVPVVLAVPASTIVGRKAAGDVTVLTPAELAALFGTPNGTKFLADDGTLKVPAIGTTHTLVRKTADESVVSSQTLQDDNELLFAVGANEFWIAEFTLFIESTSTTPDFQVTATLPTFATGMGGWDGLTPASTTQTGDMKSSAIGIPSSSSSFASLNATHMVHGHYFINVGANAGNVTIRWAQSVSDAAAVTVKAGSYLIAHKVA